tara:strand:+ start:375 stop:572 length:198 start_codon:yes stop_codon:yes gene_type:complete
LFNINFSDLLAAIALLFIFEGLMPFLNPDGIRKFFQVVAQLDNQKLRFLGITSMLFGILLLYIVR